MAGLEATKFGSNGSDAVIFIDTNLLFQCVPLEEIEWSIVYPSDEIQQLRLIVSNPVLREIDFRKNRGNERIGRRARKISAFLRDYLNSEYIPVRKSDPRVELRVETQHQPSKALAASLNYEERDDQLIGIAYEFKKRNPHSNVRLLTHDTMLLFKARELSFATDSIPDEWLLEPESTESEKRLTALGKEVELLRKQAPSFQILALDQESNQIDSYDYSYVWIDPLTDAEIGKIMREIEHIYPLVTDFAPGEATRSPPLTIGELLLRTKKTYSPPSEEKISKYRDEAYPKWLSRCEEILRYLHVYLQATKPKPRFVFTAENRGTRPAASALVTIEALGDLRVKPVSQGSGEKGDGPEGSAEREKPGAIELPAPPTAPSGKWETTGAGVFGLGLLNQPNPFGLIHSGFDPSVLQSNLDFLTPTMPTISEPARHDPNSFYYKPKFPKVPMGSYALECDQWRHDEKRVSFRGEISFSSDLAKVEGAIRLKIQAENLSKLQSKTIRVRITTKHVNCREKAQELVAGLRADGD